MSADVDRISQLFKNVDLSLHRRGSDLSAPKTFHLTPNVIYPQPHTGLGGTSSSLSLPRDHRESSPGPVLVRGKNCQVHVPPGISHERRGSTGNILWKKGSPSPPSHSPHAHTHSVGLDMSRRGSTPGDILMFPKKDSRKFSQDSIDLNEPVGNQRHWGQTAGVIMEEENEPIGNQNVKPKFIAVTTVEDVQAIRCAEFHPRGHVYAVGSNSKTLRICAYPDTHNLSKNHVTQEPTVLFKRNKHHRVNGLTE